MREYGDTPLLAPFREFYREVIRLKRMVKTGVWTAPGAAAPEPEEARAAAGTWYYFPDFIPDAEAEAEGGARFAPPGGPAPWDAPVPGGPAPAEAVPGQQLVPSEHARLCTLVWQRLITLFERQEARAWRYGGTLGADFYKDAKYVMVALADEILLNTEWEGRRFWVSNLLESKIFGTHEAGGRFFQLLDRLLAERNPVYRDLGAVYLMALTLDFRGKYRGGGRGDAERLLDYRRRLFSFVFQRDPDLGDEPRRLFPETYYHTLRDETRRRLPNPRAWIILFCAVVLAYLAITHGIWVNLTGTLSEATGRITREVNEPGNIR